MGVSPSKPLNRFLGSDEPGLHQGVSGVKQDGGKSDREMRTRLGWGIPRPFERKKKIVEQPKWTPWVKHQNNCVSSRSRTRAGLEQSRLPSQYTQRSLVHVLSKGGEGVWRGYDTTAQTMSDRIFIWKKERLPPLCLGTMVVGATWRGPQNGGSKADVRRG